MTALPFGQYQPDVSDLNRQYTQSVLNVMPQGDGYGPFYGPAVYSQALPANARGCFYARKKDGSVAIFAGTATKLYLLDNTSLAWIDVSKSSGTYTQLDAEANWSFAQFNDFVIATQNNDDMQAFELSSDSEFADLSADAPRAAYVAVIGRFLVAGGMDANPNRVQWSALNAITNWTTLEADSQDLPDGGAVRGFKGGEFGIIVQAGALRRMTFVPGSDAIFQIDRIADDMGSDLPWSIVEAAGQVFLISQKGFIKLSPEGGITPIGEERVNRTFFNTYDPAQPQLIQGASLPEQNAVMWVYKTVDNASTGVFDRSLVFDYVQNKWVPVMLEGQSLASVSQSGFTLEGLGTIGSTEISGAADNGSGLIRLTVTTTSAWTTGMIKDVAEVTGTTEANGTWIITVVDGTHIDLQGSTFSNAYVSGGYVAGSVDDLEVSLDDFSTASLPKSAIFNSMAKLSFFSGDPLEATLETSEQSGLLTRLFCSGVTPITDAPEVYASIAGRETLNGTPSYTAESLINAQGFCPQRISTRHLRVKLRIPAGTRWTYASGAEPIVQPDGER